MLLNDRLELVGSVVKVGGKVGGGSSVVEGVSRLETGGSRSWGPDSRKLRSSMPSGSVKLLGRVGRQLGCLLVVS